MLGDKLKSYRLSRHLTQDDVATALNLTIRRISSYESGEAEPDLYTLADLADFYEISLDDLMDRQSPSVTDADGYSLSLAKFGDRIRRFREEKAIPPKTIADRAHISVQYLSAIEKGFRIPKFDTAIELMNALGMSADFALADNLVAAHTTRARYLETLIPSLRPTNQRIMLDTIESVFRTLAEIEKACQ